MARAMGMSETSIEESTRKMRARQGRMTGRKARSGREFPGESSDWMPGALPGGRNIP